MINKYERIITNPVLEYIHTTKSTIWLCLFNGVIHEINLKWIYLKNYKLNIILKLAKLNQFW